MFGGRVDPLARRPGESLPNVDRQESAEIAVSVCDVCGDRRRLEGGLRVFSCQTPTAEVHGSATTQLLAKRQLARWYLANDRIRDAIPICEELAALDVTDENSRVFGIAGLAIAYYRLGEMEQSGQLVVKRWDAVTRSIRRCTTSWRASRERCGTTERVRWPFCWKVPRALLDVCRIELTIGHTVETLWILRTRTQQDKLPPSSSGLGHRILSPTTGVRLP